ncbi:NAD(P)H-binding protein [Streptacidiphilus cavernicola]|uniref:NAD(P)H-binding protein n=1 Tax=Streptacidiphilus cavernicola TaxID=3342716 RepID=A0ABV6VWB2_9ACTN
MSILVTGARGKVGQAVIGRLHAEGRAVRAGSNSPAQLDVPSGVEAVELGLSRPETFEPALRGVRELFLYPEPSGVQELLKAAEAAGVERVVLLSSSSVAGPEAETDAVALPHLLVERALAASPLPATVLRPDAFAGNALGWSHAIRAQAPVPLAYPDAQVAPIHPEDLADLAVTALTGPVFEGRILDLTGPESLSFREQLALIGDRLGREVPVQQITRAEAEEQMGRFLPDPMVASLLDLWLRATAGPARIADTTATLLGTPARTFGQWVDANLAAFTGLTG